MAPRRLFDGAGAAAARSPWAGRAGVASLVWLALWLFALGIARRGVGEWRLGLSPVAAQGMLQGGGLAGMLVLGLLGGARFGWPNWRRAAGWSIALTVLVAAASWGVQWGADRWNAAFPGHPLPPFPEVPAWRGFSGAERAVFLLSALWFGPMLEELLFRGVLAGLATRAFGAAAGVAVSALLFGLAHGVTPAVVPLALFGVFQCLARPKVGLAGLAVAHGVYNAVAIGFSVLAA